MSSIRMVLGCVFLTATAMKGYQLATEPVVNNSPFALRWFLITARQFELIFGV